MKPNTLHIVCSIVLTGLYFQSCFASQSSQVISARLAENGLDGLPEILAHLYEDEEFDKQVALDALEIIHTRENDKQFLLHAIGHPDKKIARSAWELLTYACVYSVRRPPDGRKFYYACDFNTTISRVEKYSKGKLSTDERKAIDRALQVLKKNRRMLKEDDRHRAFRCSLPSQLRREVTDLANEVKNTQNIIIAVVAFDKVNRSAPQLTEEQIYEVASIFGNAININARYFMGYKNGMKNEGGVIANPGYDFKDTRDNLRNCP